MLMLGLRLNLNTVEKVIITVIGLYELMIVLRVLLSWLHRLDVVPEGGFSAFLTVVTEPVLSPIREALFRLTGSKNIDFSPVVAILLAELLQWLVSVIL